MIHQYRDINLTLVLHLHSVGNPKKRPHYLLHCNFDLFQRLSLPPAIKGRRDILGAAETGSGKTLAFGIPIIHGILNSIETESKGRPY